MVGNPSQPPPSLTVEERSWLAEVGRFHRVAEGEAVVAAGAPLDGLYLVFRGRLVISSARRSGPAAQERVVLEVGQVFGATTPGEVQASPYRVRALEDTTLVHLDSAALARLLAAHLGLGSRLLFQQHSLLERFSRRPEGAPEPGRVLAVYGPRGGAGATSMAILTAGLAGDLGVSTLLVDLHPWFGEVAPLCEWRPSGDVVTMLDGDLHADRLAQLAGTGRAFDVLAAPRRLEDGERLEPPRVLELLRLAQANYELVVVDLPEGLSEVVLDVLGVADTILLALTADFEGLLSGRRVPEVLELVGAPEDAVEVVMNRFRGAGGLTPQQLRDTLGRPAMVVAEDHGQLLRLANDGRLLEAPSQLAAHPLVQATRRVLGRVLGLEPVAGGLVPELFGEELELLSAGEGVPEAPPAGLGAGLLGALLVGLLVLLGVG